MDLDSSERYAAAALFTLALHTTHIEVGVDELARKLADSKSAWGCTDEELFDDLICISEADPWEGVQVPPGFWGFDCVGPMGICRRVYQALSIPERNWAGLLKLPDVSQAPNTLDAQMHLVSLVRRYCTLLDPNIALHIVEATAARWRELAEQEAAQLEAQAALSEQQGPEGGGLAQQEQAAAAPEVPELPPAPEAVASAPQPHPAAAVGSGPDPVVAADALGAEAAPGGSSAAGDDDRTNTAVGTSVSSRRGSGKRASDTGAVSYEPTHQSVMALYELIGACLMVSTPLAEDMSVHGQNNATGYSALPADADTSVGSNISYGSAARSGGAGKAAASRSGADDAAVAIFRKPLVRWYDARTRVALRRICHWLRIPAAKLQAFEAMWALQMLQLGQGQEVEYDAVSDSRSRRRYTTYLKIGAGALGGAALLALTGGLAAPAIAAGLGTAVTVLHGGAAAAAAVSTLGASGVGTAAISGTFGIVGASHAGSKAAHLFGEVKEFGFWDISQSIYLSEKPAGGAPTGAAAKAPASGASAAAAAAPLPPPGPSKPASKRASSSGCTTGSDSMPQGQKAVPASGGAAPGAPRSPSPSSWSLFGRRSKDPEPHALMGKGGSSASLGELQALAAQPHAAVSAPAPPTCNATRQEATDHGLVTLAASAAASTTVEADTVAALPACTLPAWGAGAGHGLASEGLFVPSVLLSEGADGSTGLPAVFAQQAPSACSPPHASELYTGDGLRQSMALQPAPDADPPMPGHTAAEGASAGDGVGADSPTAGGSNSCSGVRSRRSSCPFDGSDVGGDEAVAQPSEACPVGASDRGLPSEDPSAPTLEPVLSALQAALDAEAADLDGDVSVGEPGDGDDVGHSTEQEAGAATPSGAVTGAPAAASAALTTPADGAGGGGDELADTRASSASSSSSSLWQWFRGKKAPELRQVLPVPVNPRRSGEATLALTIAVNGWVKEPEDFVQPWQPLPSCGRERWALVWEREVLASLGGALRRFIRDKAIEESSKMVVRLSISTALISAMIIPFAIISAINLTIGSKWRVVLRRAQVAGRCLAHLLMRGAHGDRPVTLVGFSMGARLIFHCLLELSRCGARGLVEGAVLLGTPVSCNEARWAAARSVVAGRFVSAYSANDWVLGIIFRAHSKNSLLRRCAGLAAVPVPGVENVNLSSLIDGHTQYLDKMEDVLMAVNLSET